MLPPANNGKNYKLNSSYKIHAPGLIIIGILPTHAVHAVLTHASIPGVDPSAFHGYTFPFRVTPLATLWGCYTTYADGSPPGSPLLLRLRWLSPTQLAIAAVGLLVALCHACAPVVGPDQTWAAGMEDKYVKNK